MELWDIPYKKMLEALLEWMRDYMPPEHRAMIEQVEKISTMQKQLLVIQRV